MSPGDATPEYADDPSVGGEADPTVTRINRADVAVTKGLAAFSADRGVGGVEDDTITGTFTLTVSNHGPDEATDVAVFDPTESTCPDPPGLRVSGRGDARGQRRVPLPGLEPAVPLPRGRTTAPGL